MNRRSFGWAVVAAGLSACSGGRADQVQLPPPTVGVVEALTATVAGEGRFVGTIEAVQRVELRVRVQGTIEDKFFIDGEDVKEGEKLFQIDPRSPQAALAQSRATLADARAQFQKAQADARRARSLYESNAISRAELDTALARERAARAGVSAGRAVVESAALDTQYTVIRAPFDGQIGSTTVNVGNLVSPSTPTPLATVVKLDPIYVEFSLSERQYLRARPADGERAALGPSDLLVALQLADGSIYQYRGRLVFISPELNQTTGTFTVRAIFPNPHRLLRPGQFAKVILRGKDPQRKTLVPEEAIVTKQTGDFVYVVDEDDVAEERAVTRGDPRGALRIIEAGLSDGERIVAKGVHKVRDGAEVDASEMPPLDLSSDPLSVAPPEVYPGDWYQEYAPQLESRPVSASDPTDATGPGN
jgi:RND family efflux transporter MFP subunit